MARIKALVRQVRETKEGSCISAYVVIDKKGKDLAHIHVHHSINKKGHIYRADIFQPSIRDGFNQYRGDTLASALHQALVCGVRLYDHASTGAETTRWLELYKKAKTPEGKTKVVLKAEKYGMTFVNANTEGFQSLHFVGGLERLQFFGFKVIQVM